jgi:branched-chain amino acid transport system ATP-binding protein
VNTAGDMTSRAGAAQPDRVPDLELRGVSAGYFDDIDILQNVSLRVPKGATVGVIGLNGAGKSTIMRAIYGFVPPRTGQVFVDGEDVTRVPEYAMLKRRVWFIPQESSLFAYLTVQDNLELVRRLLSGAAPEPPPRPLEEIYEAFPDLARARHSQAGDLSGGQQKMVQFALALMTRPKLCLIDEPTVGLSPKFAENVYGWIDGFRQEGMSILMVDHNVRRVIAETDYIYVLSLGRIAGEGSREDFERDLHGQVKEWLGINL